MQVVSQQHKLLAKNPLILPDHSGTLECLTLGSRAESAVRADAPPPGRDPFLDPLLNPRVGAQPPRERNGREDVDLTETNPALAKKILSLMDDQRLKTPAVIGINRTTWLEVLRSSDGIVIQTYTLIPRDPAHPGDGSRRDVETLTFTRDSNRHILASAFRTPSVGGRTVPLDEVAVPRCTPEVEKDILRRTDNDSGRAESRVKIVSDYVRVLELIELRDGLLNNLMKPKKP